MVLELHTDSRREAVDLREEYILQLAYDKRTYPMLTALWDSFYDSPQYTYGDCGLLAHELICLADTHRSDTNTLRICVRLARFFSDAHHAKESVRCLSD
jgi:hypothetical protein